MIDAHCHLDAPAFDADREGVLAEAIAAGVRGFVVAGFSPDRWEVQAQIERRWPRARAAFGIHPWAAASMDEGELEAGLASLHQRARFAVGEMGFDRSKRCPPNTLEAQRAAFRGQLALARARDLPVIIHAVRAHGLVLELLRQDGLPNRGGMVHSFAGSTDVAQQYERLGLYLSLSSAVSNPRHKRARLAAVSISDERLLIETDCPDQPPVERAARRNRPAWLVGTAREVAALRAVTPDRIAELTAQNARALFGVVEDWT